MGKDPEIKYTPQGTPVARISLATNERFKKGDEWHDRPEWHNVILWARLAEIAKEYLHKGSKIAIEGSLRTRSWDADGVKRYSTEIVAHDLIMLDSKPARGEEKVPTPAENIHGVAVTDEDIPF
jgi:single-strand DNA-binding protein